jgi:hypothetical protein
MLSACILVIAAVRTAKKRSGDWFPRHRRLALSGALSGILGILVIAAFKIVKDYPHFKSPHAMGGGIVLLILITTPLFGLLLTRGKEPLRGPHKIMGRVLAGLAVLAAVTGVLRLLQISGIV